MSKDAFIKKYVVAKNSIQLIEVSLEQSQFNKVGLITEKLQHNLSFSYQVKVENEKVYGFLKTNVESINSNGEIALVVETIHKGSFQFPQDIKLELVEEFAHVQTVPQLISYARSHIQFVSSQMISEPIQLPTMDIIESLIQNADE